MPKRLTITVVIKKIEKTGDPCFQKYSFDAGYHIENVVVPFSDGRKALNVLSPLDKTLIQVARK